MKALFTGLCLLLVCLLSSCSRHEEMTSLLAPGSSSIVIKKKSRAEEILESIPKNIQPVFGYRFVITGDFNGDGRKDTLTEHFMSGADHRETNKFYDSLPDYEQLVTLTVQKDPISFVSASNKRIDTLHIASGGQLFGLSYLKNEGDLNGDGTDEVSYVIDHADWSNANSWHIMTYRNKAWKELLAFDIWDWQLPPLPEAGNQYGLFGTEDKIVLPARDTFNLYLEKQLKAFKGLVKKAGPHRIRIIYKNEETGQDSMFIDLSKLPAK